MTTHTHTHTHIWQLAFEMFAAAALLLAIDGEARRAPSARAHHYEHGETIDRMIQGARPEAEWTPCCTVGSANSHSGPRAWASSNATDADAGHDDTKRRTAAAETKNRMQQQPNAPETQAMDEATTSSAIRVYRVGD